GHRVSHHRGMRRLVLVTMLVLGLGLGATACGGGAQDRKQQNIQDLESKVSQLRLEVENLRLEVNALREEVAGATTTTTGPGGTAVDEGSWTALTRAERAQYLRALGDAVMERADAVAEAWTRETGTIHRITQHGAIGAKMSFEQYAALADTFAWEEEAKPSMP